MVDASQLPIGSTKRTFDVVETVQQLGTARVSEVADERDLPESTAHAYLRSLVELGYLVRDDQKYRLSLKFLHVGGSARRDRSIFDVGRPTVDRLADETGERANLMVEENGEGIYVYKAMGESGVKLDTFPGTILPLHTTALGKAILAHLPDERIAELVDDRPLEKVTENTITSPDQLRSELESIRERGYAMDDEELNEGMRCVAAPILVDEAVLGAVSASGPVGRVHGSRFEEELPNQVRSAANVIKVNLKHS